MKPLLPRERRILALGILVALVALVWLGVITPLAASFGERAQEREQLRAAYARNQRVLAHAGAWRAELELQRKTSGTYAVIAPSDGSAAEVLRERLTRTFVDQGAAVQTIQAVDADAPAGSLRMRADIRATFSQLNEGLKRLQAEEPYVVVELLSVTADRAVEAGHLAPMDVRLEISASVRPPNAS